ncbi:MAG: cysteine hydrolase [Alphaproteobacteria bacterium]|nr:cysteine hydrolase [Alphaproteobacteria bacterium]
MDGLLVIDMQEGLRGGPPKHRLTEVVATINGLAADLRRRGRPVVFVQHHGPPGDEFAPGAPGWHLLAELARAPSDRVVPKSLNDAFFGTALRDDLAGLGVDRLIVTGWATDLCVDATIRSAVALGFAVVAAADGHTVSDRPHLDAAGVIAHHHWVWRNLIAPRPVAVLPAAALLAGAETPSGG